MRSFRSQCWHQLVEKKLPTFLPHTTETQIFQKKTNQNQTMIGKALKNITKTNLYIYRSLLVIKNSPSAFSKIKSYNADCNVLDLDDSVPSNLKLTQRQNIKKILDTDLENINIAIRINNLSYKYL